jgi:uncharacterized protein YeaO (DUF488 family)
MHPLAASIVTRRVYESPSDDDGERILVDRIWPRGLSRHSLKLDEWLREIAPSDALRKWFGHDQGRWPEFLRLYEEELRAPEKQALVAGLRSRALAGRVTLLYGARDQTHNNAVALRAFLIGELCAAASLA